MRRVWLIATLVLFLSMAWWALGQAPAQPAQPAAPATKIGLVSTERVIAESAEGKAVQKDLETKFAPRQKELQARAAELEKLQADLQKQQATLSEAEQRRRLLEIQQKQKSAERFQEDLQADMNAAREDALGRLAKRVNSVVQKFGADKGYFLIFDASASGALYAGAGADLTAEVLAAYNQQFPVKTP